MVITEGCHLEDQHKKQAKVVITEGCHLEDQRKKQAKVVITVGCHLQEQHQQIKGKRSSKTGGP